MINRNARHAELMRLVDLDPTATEADRKLARRSPSAAATVLEVHGYPMTKVTPGMQEDELSQSDEEDRRILEAEAKSIPAKIKQLAVRLARLKRILAAGAPFVGKSDDDDDGPRIMKAADDLIDAHAEAERQDGETSEAAHSRLAHSGDGTYIELVKVRDEAYGFALEATVPGHARLAKSKAALARPAIEGQIEKLAQARADRDGVSHAEGYARLMETAEGASLYQLLTGTD